VCMVARVPTVEMKTMEDCTNKGNAVKTHSDEESWSKRHIGMNWKDVLFVCFE
jgi:hypothetical protein